MRKHIGEFLVAALLAAVAMTGLLGSPRPVYAWTDVLVRVDTAMPSAVFVASGTSAGAGATRIDNWNKGVQGTGGQTLLSGRTGLCCQNLHATAHVFVGWSATTSTQAVVTTFPTPGEDLAPAGKTCRAADRSLALYALAADAAGAAGVPLECEQFGKANP